MIHGEFPLPAPKISDESGAAGHNERNTQAYLRVDSLSSHLLSPPDVISEAANTSLRREALYPATSLPLPHLLRG
ncbi:hypothetical protein O3P69_016357 [Scylla paramamosain]|uniref:Uncharacterized protein n=1 Tax=Scylla paramamosain TaxID=85552 RepID=A0AAW0TDT2_SCYPA